MKCWDGWITSWNQDFLEKYQPSQICRWYHSNDRKWRGTKDSPDEGERGSKTAGLKLSIKKLRSWHQVPCLHGKQMGKRGSMGQILFSWSPPRQWLSHKIKRHVLFGRKAMTNSDSVLKSRDIILPTKVHIVKTMFFLVVMDGCELDHREGWALRKWCFWIVVQEKTLESPLDCKIKPVNPNGNQPWIYIRRTDAEGDAPILWPPNMKSQPTGKAPDAGKN